MITGFRVSAKALALAALTCPQLLCVSFAALLAVPTPALSGEITDRQIATMGLPASERVKIICEGRETSKLCQKLINEVDYRDLWLETADKLTRAEWLVAEKLVELHGQIDQANEAMQKMIDRAPKLPDGRAIFRAEDGRYFDVEGNLVTPEEAAQAK